MFTTIFQTCRDYVTLNILIFFVLVPPPSGLWRLLPVKGEQHCVYIPWAQLPAVSESKGESTNTNACNQILRSRNKLPSLWYKSTRFAVSPDFLKHKNRATCLHSAGSAALVSASWNVHVATYWYFISFLWWSKKKKKGSPLMCRPILPSTCMCCCCVSRRSP